MRAADPTVTVRTMIAAIPNDRLIELLLDLLARSLPAHAAAEPAPAPETPAPPRVRRGWPRGKPRGPRKAKRNRAATKRTGVNTARRRRYAEQRSAAKRPADHAARPTAASGSTDAGGISAATFWEHAAKLEPARPWAAVSREFDVREPVAQNCYRNRSLPPQVGPMAVTRFLTLPVGT